MISPLFTHYNVVSLMNHVQSQLYPMIFQYSPCIYTYIYIYGGFHKWGYPKIDGLQWNTLLKWMIWGYPYFRKPPYICYDIPIVHPLYLDQKCPENAPCFIPFPVRSEAHVIRHQHNGLRLRLVQCICCAEVFQGLA